jgi:hypothetical protein
LPLLELKPCEAVRTNGPVNFQGIEFFTLPAHDFLKAPPMHNVAYVRITGHKVANKEK